MRLSNAESLLREEILRIEKKLSNLNPGNDENLKMLQEMYKDKIENLNRELEYIMHL